MGVRISLRVETENACLCVQRLSFVCKICYHQMLGGWSLCVCVFVVVYLQIKSVQLQDCICVFVSLALYISSCSGTLLRAKFVRDLALCAILQTKNKQLNWFIILLLHPTNQTPLKLVWGEYNAHVMLVFFFRISCFVVRHFFDAIAYPPNWVSQWVSQ